MTADLSDLPVGSAEGEAAPSAEAALPRLLALDPGTFASEVWSRRAWLSRGAELSGEVRDVFSAAAVDELLSQRGLRTPFLRLAKDGRIVPPARYTGSGGIGATVGDQVHDEAVLQLFADGSTVVLQGVHRTWAPVSALAAQLAAELGHPVQVNAYVTPPQSQGFAPHYDTHDVFVLQVAGGKQWRVHEPVRSAPLPEEPWEQVADAVRARAAEPPVLDATLEPGDCLYLPRGFVHAATALGGTSIHLTFGVHPTTSRDIVRAVLAEVEAQGWRDSLPAGWDPTSASGTDAVRDVLRRLTGALDQVDAAQVGRRLHDQRSGRQRPEPLSPLAQAATAAALTAEDVVRLRAHLGARLSPGEPGEQDDLVLPHRRIGVEQRARAAVAALLTGAPLRVGDLPGLTEADAVALGRRLLRQGVLVPADHG